jgi:hypothetical protein
LIDSQKSAEEIEEEIGMLWKTRELAVAQKNKAGRQQQQAFQNAQEQIRKSMGSQEQGLKFDDDPDDELSQHTTQPMDTLSGQQSGDAQRKRTYDSTPVQAELRRSSRSTATAESKGGDAKKQRLDDVYDPKKDKCELCGDWQCDQGKLTMLQCDGCEHFYHMKCLSMRKKPGKNDGWLCHGCIRPHQRLEIWWPKDKRWHAASVTMQYSRGQGTDIVYDSGETQHLDLDFEKWRPEPVRSLEQYVHSIGIMERPTQRLLHKISLTRTPKTHRELMKLPAADREEWIESENKEFHTITNKHKAIKLLHWEQIPEGAQIVPTQWVYVTKSCGKKKSRVVVCGNRVERDANISVESPTPKLSTIRHLFAIAVKEQWTMDILDVNGAFLYAQPSKPMYIHLPSGREGPNGEKYALCLKNLYGGYDCPKVWNQLLHNWLISENFKRNPHDACMYEKVVDGVPLYVIAHVDDLAVVSSRENTDAFKKKLAEMFECSEEHDSVDSEGKFTRYLGMELRRDEEQLVITQHHLIEKLYAAAAQYIPQNMKTPAVPILAKKLDKTTCPASPEDVQYMRRLPYRNLLGMCGYACLGTRPDACYAYKTLASFANCYGKDHWHALLQFILYLYSTRKTHVLRFTKSGGRDLNGYSDADWNGTWNMKSTSGWILFLGSSPISWCSRTQKNVSRSVGEAEYVSLAELCTEAAHHRMLGITLGQNHGSVSMFSNSGSAAEPGCVRIWQESDEFKKMSGRHKLQECKAVHVWTDSANAISFAKKDWTADKLRHIKTCWHFFKQYVKAGEISLHHCPGTSNPSDILTKAYGAGEGQNNQKAKEFRKNAMFCLGDRYSIQ